MRRNSDSVQSARRKHERGGVRILSVLFVLAVASPGLALANPIKHQNHTASAHKGRPALPAWHAFLMKGPGYWARNQPPEINNAVHQVMNRALKSADPLSTLNVQYL